METALVPYVLEFRPYQYKDGDWGLQWDNHVVDKSISVALFDRSIRNARGASKSALDFVVSKLPDPKAYLEANRERHSWAVMLLQHGREFSADKAEPWHLRRPWECFNNA